MADHTYPQNDDPDDAENFGEWMGQQNLGDFVEYGLNFTVDYATPSLDVSEGKVYAIVDSATAETSQETRHRLLVESHLDARNGLALTDGAVNYIFAETNFATNDDPSIVVKTTDSAPSDSAVKIGEVDTTSDVATELNREPSAQFVGPTTVVAEDGSTKLHVPANGPTELDASAQTPSGDGFWHAGNDGGGSGLHADLLDTLHREQFSRNVRTYDLRNETASNVEIQKVGILVPDGENINAARIRMDFGQQEGEGSNPTLDVYFNANNGNGDEAANHEVSGDIGGVANDPGVIIRKTQDNSRETGNYRYHLYAQLPKYSEAELTVKYSRHWKEDRQTGLSDADMVGSDMYDTRDNGATRERAFGASTAKVMNGVVYGGHDDFATAQDAIDFAFANGFSRVLYPAVQYGSVDVPGGLAIEGTISPGLGGGPYTAFSGGDTDHAVEITGNGASVENVRVATTKGSGTTYNAVHAPVDQAYISNVFVSESDNHGIFIDGQNSLVTEFVRTSSTNVDGDDVLLGSNSTYSIAGQLVGTTVVNNGANNVVGNTT